MSATLLAAVAALLPLADPQPPKTGTIDNKSKPAADTARKPNPLAPSLPELSEDEEKKTDAVIDRFIDADTGKLTGPEAKKAIQDFHKLGPEATFALIRGLNKAAAIDYSCPAVTIARKLGTTLRSTTDTQLLEYARENIGAGVTRSRHMAVIKDLKVACTVRKGQLER
ncbi:MAG TPA: hypothetical protein VGF55_03855 [Gemmataceae bacterium]|jgi:hypothetical protein